MARLLEADREERIEAIQQLSPEDRAALWMGIQYEWSVWARPLVSKPDGTFGGQLPPPGDWRFWWVLAGRGFGKTRTGAEWIRSKAESGKHRWLTIVAPTREALRKIMLKGPAGLLTISPPWFAPKYEPSKLLLTWPAHPETGIVCQARLYSAEKPDRLRGEQHEIVWADELPAWNKPQEAFEQIDMGLRLGAHPQMLLTTTPRPIPLVLDEVKGRRDKATGLRVKRPDVVVTTGWSSENSANLSSGYVQSLESRFGDSAFGRQELRAEILEAPEGALWSAKLLEDTRVEAVPSTIRRTVVAVDPTRADDPVDECGIVVIGIGEDQQAYVLFDKSVYGSPLTWIKAAVSAYRMHGSEKIIYESNRLGATVEDSLRAFDRDVRWEGVKATEGKHARAVPIASLYESGKVHHVGNFRELEDEMVLFDPKDRNRPSPNRMDALVWGLTYLMLGDQPKPLKLV